MNDLHLGRAHGSEEVKNWTNAKDRFSAFSFLGGILQLVILLLAVIS